MREIFVFFLLGALIGCAKPKTTSPLDIEPSAVEATTEEVGTAAMPDAYPEKAEVIRLMHRANIEFDAGRYSDALEIVQMALAVDPASVAATALRDRINEILVRS